MPTKTMLGVGKEVTVLSDHEQRVWQDIERFWAEDAEEPTQPRLVTPKQRNRPSQELADLPMWAGAGARISIILILFGALVPGLAIGVATFLAWALWRYWSQLSGMAATSALQGTAAADVEPRAAGCSADG